MEDLKSNLVFCIDNFSTEDAAERIFNFINDALKLKEEEIKLRNSIKIPSTLKPKY